MKADMTPCARSDVAHARHRWPYVKYILIAGCLVSGSGVAKVASGWELEQAGGHPTFATAVPSRTNLDIDSVVLACERADDGAVLQLELYPTESEVSTRGIGPPVWSYGRRAEVEIDGRVFPIDVLFADDHVVLADDTRGRFPALSERLLDAMATGRTMQLRISVDVEAISTKFGVDGYATVDLQAGQGGAAVTALRRCASPKRSGV